MAKILKTFILPEIFGGATIELNCAMCRRYFDNLQRLNSEKNFAEADRNAKLMQEITDKIFLTKLREVMVNPPLDEKEFNDPEVDMQKYMYILSLVEDEMNISPSRIKDLKKKQSEQ